MQISHQTPQLPATIIYSEVQTTNNKVFINKWQNFSLLYVLQTAIMLIQVRQNIRQKAKLNKIKC